MAVFNDIRQVLIDPTTDGQSKRAEIFKTAAFFKGCSGLAMGVMGGVTAVAYIATRSFPLIGGIFAFAGAVGFVGAHEVMITSRNVEEMTKGDGPLGNVFRRASAALSKSEFTKKITQDTWIVGPLFGSAIEAELKN